MWSRVKDRAQRLREVWSAATTVLGACWGRLRDEPVFGVALSLVLHAALIVLIVYLGGPGTKYATKRGEPLFVELPEIKDEAPRGNPAARTVGPPETPSPEPPRPPVAKAQPTPPAPKAPPPAKVTEATPKPAEPQRVASARPPDPAREPSEPATPKPPEPPPSEAKDAPAIPTQEARPAPDVPAAPAREVRAAPAAPPPPVPEPPRGGTPGSQVASLPPSPREPVFDLKSLGRGGGAGGRAEGRGGIEGEPIPLDSQDPKFNEYLDRIRRMIKERWGYPCVKTGPGQCEYKTAQLVIEFGIAKDGKVPFVNVMRTSGFPIYDDYAVNAIKLASPFPPVPDSFSKKGVPIMATFNYIVDTSLVNMLR